MQSSAAFVLQQHWRMRRRSPRDLGEQSSEVHRVPTSVGGAEPSGRHSVLSGLSEVLQEGSGPAELEDGSPWDMPSPHGHELHLGA